MASMVVLIFVSCLATALAGTQGVQKRGLAHYDYDAYNFDGHNSIEDYSHHYSAYAHSLPAYSTVSYVMANGHKPVSYSGFTNHGRGHHDPGYSVQYRSEGFGASHEHDHDYHNEYHNDYHNDYHHDYHHSYY